MDCAQLGEQPAASGSTHSPTRPVPKIEAHSFTESAARLQQNMCESGPGQSLAFSARLRCMEQLQCDLYLETQLHEAA